MSNRPVAPWIRLVAAVLVSVLLACSTSSPAPPDPAAARSEVLVERWSSGGLCPNGPCRAGILVGDGGRWWTTPGPDSLGHGGDVPIAAASRLAEALERRWSALTSREPVRACPVVYDGQEVHWTVRRITPAEAGDGADTTVVRELGSCAWDLEHSDAARALEEMRSLWAELGLPDP